MAGNFRGVSMREQAIGAEIFVHLDEMSFALRFFSRAADAGFAVADDSARGVDPPSFDKWPQPQNDGGGIAAGIRDQARLRKRVAIKLWETIDGGSERVGGGWRE